jgi:hypothetical protein
VLGRWIRAGVCLPFFGAGCLSPTLPLPPPELPTVVPGSDANHVELISSECGGAEAGALIIIENQNPTLTGDEVGAVTRTDTCGRWEAEVYAHNGDSLQIWQEYGATSSLPETLVVSLP